MTIAAVFATVALTIATVASTEAATVASVVASSITAEAVAIAANLVALLVASVVRPLVVRGATVVSEVRMATVRSNAMHTLCFWLDRLFGKVHRTRGVDFNCSVSGERHRIDQWLSVDEAHEKQHT